MHSSLFVIVLLISLVQARERFIHSPTRGDRFKLGRDVVPIRWNPTSFPSEHVSIHLVNGGWIGSLQNVDVALNASNSGNFDWHVPYDLGCSGYRIVQGFAKGVTKHLPASCRILFRGLVDDPIYGWTIRIVPVLHEQQNRPLLTAMQQSHSFVLFPHEWQLSSAILQPNVTTHLTRQTWIPIIWNATVFAGASSVCLVLSNTAWLKSEITIARVVPNIGW